MRRIRKLSPHRKPRIKGKAKVRVKIVERYKQITAIGYVDYVNYSRNIGSINAFFDSRSDYLTVGGARLNKGWIGKGYGHVLYWALAKRAIRKGLKGLRSHAGGRNLYSNGAWKKIRTHQQGYYSYIRFD